MARPQITGQKIGDAPAFGRLTSPKLACERLNCSIPTLYKLISEQELETIKLGKYRKILERSIDALIERRLAAEKAA
jgi:excisionase family DNA binding protein